MKYEINISNDTGTFRINNNNNCTNKNSVNLYKVNETPIKTSCVPNNLRKFKLQLSPNKKPEQLHIHFI